MHVAIFPLGPLETNCYLAVNGASALAIDPGGEPARVLKYLKDKGLTLTRILNTHFHFDHILGNAALCRATGAPIAASPGDTELLATELGRGGFSGFPATPDFAFEPLAAGEITLIGLTCRVLETPGHSQGSLSFYFPDGGCVFVGDLIFYRSVGRTDFPGGDMGQLKRSAREMIFSLPEATIIYPGHGPATTVGDEKLHNPFLAPAGQGFLEDD